MVEIWKDIIGYEGLYKVSNLGRIKSLYRVVPHKSKGSKTIPESIKKLNVGTNNYYIVMLNKNGEKITKTVHRLVAIAFLSNPENKKEVNHKDGNKLNNNIYNLEWNTVSENRFHAFRTGLQHASMRLLGMKGKLCMNSKPVIQILGNGDIIKFASATTAQEEIGVSRRGISQCARGLQDLAGGYKWEYE